MTETTGFGLLELATPYALHAISETERATVERQHAAAATPIANAFDEEVRAVRETMAIVSAATAAEPPARLRTAVLAAAEPQKPSQSRWRNVLLAAAAAIIIGLAAFGAGLALRQSPTPTIAEQIMAAPDVRTASDHMVGGTATVLFSRDMNAAVVVMTDVPRPSRGTVYQMWLIDGSGPQSAGTIDRASVTPSTTHVVRGLGKSSLLALTVEPGTGSPQPTGTIITKLPLG